MYVHVGQKTVIRTKDIVGIFDTDTSTQNETTKSYLKAAQKDGRLIAVSDDIPKSFIVSSDGRVYMCQLSASVIRGRIRNF